MVKLDMQFSQWSNYRRRSEDAERRRREGRGAEGGGVWDGVSPSPMGRDTERQKCFDFRAQMVRYGAFWVLFLGERSGGVVCDNG